MNLRCVAFQLTDQPWQPLHREIDLVPAAPSGWARARRVDTPPPVPPNICTGGKRDEAAARFARWSWTRPRGGESEETDFGDKGGVSKAELSQV